MTETCRARWMASHFGPSSPNTMWRKVIVKNAMRNETDSIVPGSLIPTRDNSGSQEFTSDRKKLLAAIDELSDPTVKLAKGVTAPIVGTTKLEQLDQAIGAVDLRLDASEIQYLEELYQPHPVLGIEGPKDSAAK